MVDISSQGYSRNKFTYALTMGGARGKGNNIGDMVEQKRTSKADNRQKQVDRWRAMENSQSTEPEAKLGPAKLSLQNQMACVQYVEQTLEKNLFLRLMLQVIANVR